MHSQIVDLPDKSNTTSGLPSVTIDSVFTIQFKGLLASAKNTVQTTIAEINDEPTPALKYSGSAARLGCEKLSKTVSTM